MNKKYGAIALFAAGLVLICILFAWRSHEEQVHPQTTFDSDVQIQDGGIKKPD